MSKAKLQWRGMLGEKESLRFFDVVTVDELAGWLQRAWRVSRKAGAIQYTFETFALFGFDGILLPPRFLIRLGAATGARPSSGFEQGLYNRAIWGV